MELIASILSGAKNGASKTKIMYSAFMSFDQLQKYIGLTLELKLISSAGDNKYCITAKGMQFLNHFEELQKMENVMMEKKRALNELLQNAEK